MGVEMPPSVKQFQRRQRVWLLALAAAVLLAIGGCGAKMAYHMAIYRGDVPTAYVFLTFFPALANSTREIDEDFPWWRLTPLSEAIAIRNEAKRARMIRLLLAKGADPNGEFFWQGTPLEYAARERQYETLELLLDSGADPDRVTFNNTPLSEAADVGFWRGAELMARGRSKLPAAIRLAVLRDGPALLDELARAPEQARATDGTGRTALHYAAQRGDVHIVRLLLARGASTAARDKCLDTPLHLAARLKDPSVARLLLGKGASLRAINDHYQTPLHCAASKSPAVVRLLVSAGAGVNQRDVSGETPFDYAVAERNREIEAILKSHGGKEGD